MFPSGKKNNTNRSVKRIETSHDSAVTILTSGCHFSGKLYCRGSTRIGGKIDGEIVSEGLLIIEEEAQINANVKADEAIIQFDSNLTDLPRIVGQHQERVTRPSQFSLVLNKGKFHNRCPTWEVFQGTASPEPTFDGEFQFRASAR